MVRTVCVAVHVSSCARAEDDGGWEVPMACVREDVAVWAVVCKYDEAAVWCDRLRRRPCGLLSDIAGMRIALMRLDACGWRLAVVRVCTRCLTIHSTAVCILLHHLWSLHSVHTSECRLRRTAVGLGSRHSNPRQHVCGVPVSFAILVLSCQCARPSICIMCLTLISVPKSRVYRAVDPRVCLCLRLVTIVYGYSRNAYCYFSFLRLFEDITDHPSGTLSLMSDY